jgi:hypothetical protein
VVPAPARVTKRPIRLTVEHAAVICELLADLDGADGRIPLLEAEHIGHRRFTPLEQLAVDELRYQRDRALRLIPPSAPGPT